MCHGMDFRKSGVIVHSVDEDSLLPMFGIIKQIWSVSEFIYFETVLSGIQTIVWNKCFLILRKIHIKSKCFLILKK